MVNDGCYSKQGATSYVYLQTFCVRQILRMRYWVMMRNEACIRMLGKPVVYLCGQNTIVTINWQIINSYICHRKVI